MAQKQNYISHKIRYEYVTREDKIKREFLMYVIHITIHTTSHILDMLSHIYFNAKNILHHTIDCI